MTSIEIVEALSKLNLHSLSNEELYRLNDSLNSIISEINFITRGRHRIPHDKYKKK